MLLKLSDGSGDVSERIALGALSCPYSEALSRCRPVNYTRTAHLMSGFSQLDRGRCWYVGATSDRKRAGNKLSRSDPSSDPRAACNGLRKGLLHRA